MEDTAEEWMDYFRIKANECKGQQYDRSLKEQSINGMNDRKNNIRSNHRTHSS